MIRLENYLDHFYFLYIEEETGKINQHLEKLKEKNPEEADLIDECISIIKKERK
jgi:hypothetical protein